MDAEGMKRIVMTAVERERRLYRETAQKPPKYRRETELAERESALLTIECLAIELGLIEHGTI